MIQNKFKGVSIETQHWIEGQLIQTNEGFHIIPFDVSEIMLKNYLVYGTFKVYSEMICRFTGFTDKFDNDLYEFDIVHENGCYISWSEKLGCWCFQHVDDDQQTPLFHERSEIRILGNKHG